MCPNALSEVGLEEVNMEAGPEPLSVNVPMLETDVGATESRVDFTAEPAAASTDCVACIALKPFLGCISF